MIKCGTRAGTDVIREEEGLRQQIIDLGIRFHYSIIVIFSTIE